MPDTSPPQGDGAIFAVFELFALAFAFEGTDRLLTGHYFAALVAYIVALILMITGLKWRWIRQRIGARVASFFEGIGNDSRYWIGSVLLIAFFLAVTGLVYVRGIRSDIDIYVMPRTITDRKSVV